jgi:isopenicillin N synthase-like dioxygenase
MEQDRRIEGIDATNQAFIKYDQVEKRQEYHLAEKPGEDAFDEDFRIKTCDLGRFLKGGDADKAAFAKELGEALSEIGFAVLENHGVDPALYDETEDTTLELFTETPLEEKLRYRAQRYGSVNQGYFPIKETSGIHPDLVEGWVFCRRAFDLDGDPGYRETDFWPARQASRANGAASYERAFRRLVNAHEALILPVMQSLLRFLGGDPHHYDARLTKTNFGQRLNYYPPVEAADEASGAGRMLGHEDVDLFTFLPAARVEGLQVLNRRNMKWIRLSPPRGTIILNTGDYAQRISNDILPSTTHRVSLPRDQALRGRPRLSTPMAIYLWENEVLEVLPGLGAPKYEPIRALPFHTRITSKYYGDGYAVGD